MRQSLCRSYRWASLGCALLICAALAAGCASRSTPVVQVPSPQPQLTSATAEATSAAPASQSAGAQAAAPTASAAPAHHAATAPARARRDPKLYPNPRLTPGDVFHVTAAQVSVPGYSSKVRNVPVSEKREVFSEYGMAYPQKPGAFECDHFIPLCLGGSNAVKNLWPEPAPQFHWKDGLEVYLWRRVRSGTIGLAEAQREIRTDWYSYWVKAGRPGSAVDADSAAAQSAVLPAGKTVSGAMIVGWSVSGARYHFLTCRYFAQIKPANRRTGTIAQARAAGKTPCKVCRPPG